MHPTTLESLIAQIQRQTAQYPLRTMPDKRKAQAWIDRLLDALFPIRCTKNASLLEWRQMELALLELLMPLQNEQAEATTNQFFAQVPNVYTQLQADAQAILDFDPAAQTIEEVLVAYPGFYAIAVYRLSNILYRLQVPILPRLISEWAHTQTGIDIHPGATIGAAFFIDHGTGIVIGESCIIGEQVKIYQGVTLGALSVQKSEAHHQRHPSIEDRVTIYSNATILGGRTVVGHDSVIGGNVFLTHSVPPHSLVYHKSEVKVRTNRDFEEPINFVI
jgi:serine O-acetyltransferase